MNTEHESILLGQMLLDNRVFVDAGMREDEFQRIEHRRVFRGIEECVRAGVAADIITVSDKDPQDVGLISGLTSVPTTANWTYYRDSIRERAAKTKLARLGSELREWADSSDAAPDILDRLQKRISEIAVNESGAHIMHVREIIGPFLDEVEALFRSKGALSGISSGMRYVDGYTQGWQPGTYYIIGARPSEGKTAIALTMALHAGVNLRVPTGFISLETNATRLASRMFAQLSQINSRMVSSGMLRPSDFKDLTDAAGKLDGSELYIYDDPDAGLSRVISTIREMVTFRGVRLVFVDYLQRIAQTDRKMSRFDHVGDCSRAIQTITRTLNVPVVVLAQLGRDAQGKRPTLADLRESGQIEQDGDTIMFIHREGPREETARKLIIEKNKDGETGEVDLAFKREWVKFFDMGKDREAIS